MEKRIIPKEKKLIISKCKETKLLLLMSFKSLYHGTTRVYLVDK